MVVDYSTAMGTHRPASYSAGVFLLRPVLRKEDQGERRPAAVIRQRYGQTNQENTDRQSEEQTMQQRRYAPLSGLHL